MCNAVSGQMVVMAVSVGIRKATYVDIDTYIKIKQSLYSLFYRP
jgi:hypothetical protein